VQGIFRSILHGEASDVTVIPSFDPLGWEVESSSNGDLEVQEACVFNIPFRGLVIGFLVVSHAVSKSSELLTKFVFHLTVDCFMGSNGFEQSVTNRVEGDGINVWPDGVEGGRNCARGEQLAA
jgi:hypothetical protein